MAGAEVVLGLIRDFLPQDFVNLVASFSFLNHFAEMRKGVIDLRNLLYFLSVIGVFLFATVLVLDLKKAE